MKATIKIFHTTRGIIDKWVVDDYDLNETDKYVTDYLKERGWNIFDGDEEQLKTFKNDGGRLAISHVTRNINLFAQKATVEVHVYNV